MPGKMIINAISAVLALGVTGTSMATLASHTSKPDQMHDTMQGMEKCYGIAKAGMNDCGNNSHSCSAEAKQDGDKREWLFVPQGLCKKIVGGSTQSTSES